MLNRLFTKYVEINVLQYYNFDIVSVKGDCSMEEFIKLFDMNYDLLEYHIKDKLIVFNIESCQKELVCPYCGAKSNQIHSIYQREV